jgi:antagonist of KipI
MSLTVLDPGLYSLLVDLGRPGSRALGVPVGGAADRAALALGNGLVGNPPAAVAVEVTLAGPTVRADRRTAAVVFGAPFALTVLGKGPIAAGTTFTLEPGDMLKVGGTPTGVRGYLCVAGGFDTPAVLGSRSALGPLQAGDRLGCRESSTAARSLPFVAVPRPGGLLAPRAGADSRSESATRKTDPESAPLVVRALDGPQRDWFPDDAFFTRPFTVTPASNRMGLRLTGEPLAKRAGELVSEPVAPGAVQVTNDGLPIVLGVDGQTIGGYPKVAHVVRADLDLLAQLRPGAAVRFQRVTLDEAEAAARERADWLRGWLTRLRVTAGVNFG